MRRGGIQHHQCVGQGRFLKLPDDQLPLPGAHLPVDAFQRVALLIIAEIAGAGGILHGPLHGFHAHIPGGEGQRLHLEGHGQHQQLLTCQIGLMFFFEKAENIADHIAFHAGEHSAHVVGHEAVGHPLAALAQMGQVDHACGGIAGGAHMQSDGSDGQHALMADGDLHTDHFAAVDLLTAESIGHLHGFLGHPHADEGEHPAQENDGRQHEIDPVAHGQGAEQEEAEEDAHGQVGMFHCGKGSFRRYL